MKPYFASALFLLLVLSVHSQDKQLRAYLSYATFNVPGELPIVETYLAVEASSLVFVPVANEGYQASVGVTLIFMEGDSVRNYAKYELKSPVVSNVEKTQFGIVDQQRFPLPNGNYKLNIELTDLNNNAVPPFISTEEIQINYASDRVQLSAIELVESFSRSTSERMVSKNGYDLIPLVFPYFRAADTVLNFYAEVYHADKTFGPQGKFLITYYLESFENQSLMQEFIFRKRADAREVNVLLHSIDIGKLPSGNYNLVVEVRDHENKLVDQNKIFFQRSNPSVQYNLNDIAALNIENTFTGKISNLDTLVMMLRCIAPIATETERDYAFNLSKTTEKKTMQQFLYNFWQKRKPVDPELAWQNYFEEVKKVDASFKTQNHRGYETDRGRVYLQYGAPNHIVEAYNEPSGYPYEIWHYYTLGTQRNKRFVFVTKNLVTNYFVLVHSDAIGELANYRWEYDIYGRANVSESVDDTGTGDIFGNKAYDFYKNPR